MIQEERLKHIKKMLQKEHQVSTKEIAKKFGVSFDTARRDVIHLTTTGQAVRIHGGMMAINQNDVPGFLARSQVQSPVKLKMAKMAKRFAHPGQCDFIGSSTTLNLLCPMLNGVDMQIVTNSIDNALSLLNSDFPSVRLLGGIINKEQRYIYSEAALETIRRMRFNTAFIGGSKVGDDGVYTASMDDAEIVRAATQRANQIVLIAEKYKFTNQTTSPYMSLSLDKVDVLITDTPLSNEVKRHFNSKTQIISVLKE
ncbi:DeoR/GlpR family DNA-binding transcription regulator [uncultured Lactobacillus sp.]|uniref:DeoR/GlpR family DNA-binding transcription regulator n=1 Tax=uncultured Lactobacillus sp. TaxID=153152 RepID=UPI002805FBFE|nr:DeoR/GlpR family DNA-binding transcription regulator [uncultured Lactobacillus sp.]